MKLPKLEPKTTIQQKMGKNLKRLHPPRGIQEWLTRDKRCPTSHPSGKRQLQQGGLHYTHLRTTKGPGLVPPWSPTPVPALKKRTSAHRNTHGYFLSLVFRFANGVWLHLTHAPVGSGSGISPVGSLCSAFKIHPARAARAGQTTVPQGPQQASPPPAARPGGDGCGRQRCSAGAGREGRKPETQASLLLPVTHPGTGRGSTPDSRLCLLLSRSSRLFSGGPSSGGRRAGESTGQDSSRCGLGALSRSPKARSGQRPAPEPSTALGSTLQPPLSLGQPDRGPQQTPSPSPRVGR